MNQLPENSLRIYDVTLVTSYLIGLHMIKLKYQCPVKSLGPESIVLYSHQMSLCVF